MAKKYPKVCVIIPFKEMNELVEKCIRECLNQDYNNFEIYLLSDNDIKKEFPKTKILSTGHVFPAEKRNIAAKDTDAEICAFIDSDAYPVSKNWIKNAMKLFVNEEVGAVGGPNLVSDDADLLEKASAYVIYSKLCAGGNYPIREYRFKDTYEYREIASSNLFVRRELLLRLGGFDIYQLTSEDSKLCFQINNIGKKVIYSKDVSVYHRRRRLIWQHTKRMFIEGRNKAFVFKDLSYIRNFFYFIPSLFVLWMIFGLGLSFIFKLIGFIYLLVLLLYLALVLFEGFKYNPLKTSIIVSCGIFLTHISYGLGFIKGLFTNKYKLKKKEQLNHLKEQK